MSAVRHFPAEAAVRRHQKRSGCPWAADRPLYVSHRNAAPRAAGGAACPGNGSRQSGSRSGNGADLQDSFDLSPANRRCCRFSPAEGQRAVPDAEACPLPVSGGHHSGGAGCGDAGLRFLHARKTAQAALCAGRQSGKHAGAQRGRQPVIGTGAAGFAAAVPAVPCAGCRRKSAAADAGAVQCLYLSHAEIICVLPHRCRSISVLSGGAALSVVSRCPGAAPCGHGLYPAASGGAVPFCRGVRGYHPHGRCHFCGIQTAPCPSGGAGAGTAVVEPPGYGRDGRDCRKALWQSRGADRLQAGSICRLPAGILPALWVKSKDSTGGNLQCRRIRHLCPFCSGKIRAKAPSASRRMQRKREHGAGGGIHAGVYRRASGACAADQPAELSAPPKPQGSRAAGSGDFSGAHHHGLCAMRL